jgi:hypothetical protein
MERGEAADRVAIQAVIADYSQAVDAQDWDLLDEVFTPDCECDYTEVANFRGDRASVRAWLSAGLPAGRRYFHLMGASHIRIDGDTATAVTPCVNPMPFGEGGLGMFGLWYRDQVVHTDQGWRIAKRYLEFSWFVDLAEQADQPFRVPWG